MKKLLVASMFILLIVSGFWYVSSQTRREKADSKPGATQKQFQRSGTIELGELPFENNILTIDSVTVSHAPAWLVVYAQTNGRPGKKLTERYLEATSTEQIYLPLSPEDAAQAVYLLLHEDTGESMVFEFPTQDAAFSELQPLRVEL